MSSSNLALKGGVERVAGCSATDYTRIILLSVLIWRCFAYATGLHNSCQSKKKSSENDAWSDDLVIVSTVYLQVGEG